MPATGKPLTRRAPICLCRVSCGPAILSRAPQVSVSARPGMWPPFKPEEGLPPISLLPAGLRAAGCEVKASTPGAVPAKTGTCDPSHRPHPRSPMQPGRRPRSPGPASRGRARPWWQTPRRPGTAAWRQRPRSAIHDLGRYSSRSISAALAGGVGAEHARLAILHPPGRTEVLPLPHRGMSGSVL